MNLLANPSFEDTTLTGWEPWIPSGVVRETIASSTAQTKGGGASLLMTPLFATDGWFNAIDLVSGLTANRYAVVGGSEYTLSCWVKQGLGTRDAYIDIDWYGPSGFISTSFDLMTLAAGPFRNLSLTATAPRAATMCSPFFGAGPGTIGDFLYYDRVRFELGGGETGLYETDSPYENLVTDNSFESAVDPGTWETFGVTITRVTAESREGYGSLKVVTSGLVAEEGIKHNLSTLVPGRQYSGFFWIKGTAGATMYSTITNGLTGGSSAFQVVTPFTLTGSWQRVSHAPYVAPTAVGFTWISSMYDVAAQAITFYLDEICVAHLLTEVAA